MPNLYIISGCNGAGKTTASYSVLPDMLDCNEFVNADEIARGLSPFQPDKVAIERERKRVLAGGHNIPEGTIRRRYGSGIKNLSKIYMPICDYWLIFDNSEHPSVMIAEGFKNTGKKVYSLGIYNQIIGQ